MQAKKIIGLVILFLGLSFTKLSAQTVYVTESGKKYHAKNCSLAKTGKKGIALKLAIKQGYEACKMCKADEIKVQEEKEKKEKEKAKEKK